MESCMCPSAISSVHRGACIPQIFTHSGTTQQVQFHSIYYLVKHAKKIIS